jgi:hypothetical protein
MPTVSPADLSRISLAHFKRYFYAAVLHIIEQLACSLSTREAAFEHFPFLKSYFDELVPQDEAAMHDPVTWWRDALATWQDKIPGHLPLRALQEAAGLTYEDILLLMSIGFIEEDARFELLFESMQLHPGQHRPTLTVLSALWSETFAGDGVLPHLRKMQGLGLIQVSNPDAPRMEWIFQLPGVLWDALRGTTSETILPGICYRSPTQLATPQDLIIPEALQQALPVIPPLLTSGEVQALIVRGPRHNGRRTLLGAVARMLGHGVLEIKGSSKAEDERWRLIGPLVVVLNALPIIVLDLASGETSELPLINGYDGPVGIVLGKQGGVSGPYVERALAITMDMPDIPARRQHWLQASSAFPIDPAELESISGQLRMTGGNIRRVATLAHTYATFAGAPAVTLAHVRQASRSLNRQVLETLATYLPATGSWSHLAANAEMLQELATLEQRCRHRERLHTAVGTVLKGQLNAGVRALFSGPSGTGKTFAARLLASALQMDLYRLDLSSIVNKYIGETEKNLNQVFSHAEELDVILLIDEGDALLTKRTNVQSANDRYANLETNYLLQRLEGYEGIVLVTTNASDRIDNAFQRRMDVIIDFKMPDVAERWAIWQLHLPETHSIDLALLQDVASRCLLTGGQIRNIVLHTSLLSLNDGGMITSGHFEAAILREYRKIGAACPLRSVSNKTR